MTQRRGRWRWILGLLIALAVGRGMAGLAAGAAQAEALGVRPSWRLLSAMDLSLRTLVAAIAALALFANLLAVRHSIVSVVLPRQLGNLRFGEAVPMRWLTLGAAGVAVAIGALFAAVDLDGRQLLLWLHGVRFGEVDPFLERDLGWYLVGLPVERAIWDTVVRVLAVAALLTLALYAGTPSLRLREGRLVVTGWVRRHLGLLGGVALLLLAWHWRLARYELLVTGSGATAGFGAVDHRLVLPSLLLLALLTVGLAGALVAAAWTGRGRTALGILLAAVVVGPLGEVALVTFAPSLGSTARAIQDREVAYSSTRARFTARAHGEGGPAGERGGIDLEALRRRVPPAAIIRVDGGPYRVIEDPTGRLAAAPLTTWRERVVQAWALQNPRLLLAGGGAGDRLLLGADPWSRVRRVAPFLHPAPLPRLLQRDGQLLWVLDLEIQGAWYPLADPLPDRGDTVRYRRSAGIGVVDAMTGAVRIIPPADPDPILRAWMALVPDVFGAGASVGAGIDLAAVAPAPGETRAATTEDATDGRPRSGDASSRPIGDLRAEAGALYDAMETARRAGDWAAYGAAWRRLGVLLGRATP